MANNKTNDWFVASLSSPSNSLEDFRQEGLTADNTELADKGTYLANENIKKAFIGEDKKFNQKAFDDAYSLASITYNKFANEDFDKTALSNNYYFKEDSFIPKKGKLITQETSYKRVVNPFKNLTGFAGVNLNTNNSGLSIRELAQNSEVLDKNGKSLGWTPNDDNVRGLIDFWSKPTIALAQWDEDGVHEDPMSGRMIKHKKNQFKTNHNGDYYYEELGDSDPSNKIILSVWDTNTKEGSWANKIDFMDSDGLDKSIVGSIAKAAAISVPAFIPGFGSWYTAALMGKELLDVIPATAQAIGSITGIDTNKWEWANKSRQLNRRLSTSTSDYSKANALTTENVANMMSDVFLQLSQQKLLAKIPYEYGLNKAEKEAIKQAKLQYGDQVVSDLFKSSAYESKNINDKLDILNSIPGLQNVINKYVKLGTKGGQYLSTAYMAGTSAIGVVEEAKANGLNDKDTGAMLLGLTLGYGAMMRHFEIGHWVEKGLGMDDIGKTVKKAISDAAKEYNTDIIKAKSVEEATNSFFRIGKRIGSFVSDKMTNNDYIAAAIMEGAEEVSEEMMSDSLKVAYNSLNSLGLTSTDRNKAGFAFTGEDIATRYAMNFLGGSLGGVIFKLNENFGAKALEKNSEETNKDMLYLIRNGYTDRLVSEIEKQKNNGLLASTNLSMDLTDDSEGLDENSRNYKPTSNPTDSHNHFISNVLQAQVKYLDGLVKQENIPSDKFLNDIYSERAGKIVDLGLNSSMKDDLSDLTLKLTKKKIELDSLGDTSKTNNPESARLQNEISELRKEIQQISSGDKFDYYYKQALFSMNDYINTPYGVLTINDFAKEKYNKVISEIDVNSDEYKIIEEAYKTYLKDGRKNSVKSGFEDFQEDLKKASSFASDLNDYGNHRYGYYEKVEDTASAMQGLMDPNSLDNAKEALKAKFTDAENYDVDKINQVLQGNKFISGDFKTIIDNTFRKLDKKQLQYTGINSDDFINSLISNGFKIDIDGGINSTPDEVKTAGEKVAKFINDYEFNPTNIDQFKIDLKNFLLTDKDFNDAYSFANDTEGEYDFKTDLAFNNATNIDKIADDIINNVFSRNQEFSNAFQSYNNSLNELNKKQKYNPLHELLKNFLIKIEGQSNTTPLEVLQNQMSIFDNLNHADEFVIDNKITRDQIDAAIKSLNKVRSMIYSLTDYSYKGDQFSDADIFGFGKSINFLLEKDSKPKEFDLLTTRSNAAIAQELNYISLQLNYLKALSDYNDDNKIGNFKKAGLQFSGMLLDTLKPGSEIFEMIKGLGFETSEVEELYDKSVNVNRIIDKINGNDDVIENPDEFIRGFKKEKAIIENAFFKMIDSKLSKLSSEDKTKERKRLISSLVGTFTGTDFVDLITKKTAPYNVDSKYLYPMDKLTYTLSILFSDSAKYYNKLKGSQNEDGTFDGIEQFPHAPFSAQEHASRIAYSLIENRIVFDLALFNILTKSLELSKTETNQDLLKLYKTFCVFNKGCKSSLFINGVPGAGKTSNVTNSTAYLSVKDGKNIALFGPSDEQGASILSNLSFKDTDLVNNVINKDSGRGKEDLFTAILGKELYNEINNSQNSELDYPSKNEFIVETEKIDNVFSFELRRDNDKLKDLFNTSKPFTLNINGKIPNVLYIDEATHLSKFEYEILSTAISKHNMSNSNNQISLIFTGDNEQNGFLIKALDQETSLNLNEIFMFTTPQLSQSIRTGYNIKTRNINSIRAFVSNIVNEAVKDPALTKFINFKNTLSSMNLSLHFDESNGLVGDKFVDNISLDDIKRIVNLNNGEDKIGVIVDDVVNNNIVKMISSIPGYEDIFVIRNPREVQGKEYNYVIMDVSNKLPSDNSSTFDLQVYFQKLYTAISRSRKGTLSTKSIINQITYDNITGEIIPSKTAISSEKIDSYKKLELDTINDIVEALPLEGGVVEPKAPEVKPITDDKESKESDQKKPSEDKDSKDESNDKESKKKSPQSEPSDIIKDIDPDLFNSNIDNFQKPNEEDGMSVNAKDGTKIRCYSSYERLGINVINDIATDNISNTEDLPLIYYTLTGNNINLKPTNSDEFRNARNELRKVISSFIHKGEKGNISISQAMSTIGVDRNIIDRFEFDKFKLGLRIKLYEKRDRRHDAYYTESGEKELNSRVGFLVAEVPIKGSDKTATFTIAGLSDFDNTNIPIEVKKSLVNLNNKFMSDSVKNNSKDIVYYFDKSNYEKILNPKSSLIPTKYKNRIVSLDEFKNTHQHLAVSDVYITTGKMEESVGKLPLKSGRPFILVSADKTNSDLLAAYEAQCIREKRIFLNDPKAPEYKRNIKIIPLNNSSMTFEEWYNNSISIYGNADLKRMIKVYTGRYTGVRMYNAIFKFLQTVLISSEAYNKNNDLKLSDITRLYNKDSINIKSIIDQKSINTIKFSHNLSKLSDNEIRDFIERVFNAYIYIRSSLKMNGDSFVKLDKTEDTYIRKLNNDQKKLNVNNTITINDEFGYDFINSFMKSFNDNLLAKLDKENKSKLLHSFHLMFSVDFPDGIHYHPSVYDRSVNGTDYIAIKADTQYGKFNTDCEVSLPFLHISNDMLNELNSDPLYSENKIDSDIKELNDYFNKISKENTAFDNVNLLNDLSSRIRDEIITLNDAKKEIDNENNRILKEIEDFNSGSRVDVLSDEVYNIDLNALLGTNINFDEFDLTISSLDSKSMTNNFILTYSNDNLEIFATFRFENGILVDSHIDHSKHNIEPTDLVALKSEMNDILDQLSANPNIESDINSIRDFYNKILESGSLLLSKDLVVKDYERKVMIPTKSILKSDSKEKTKLVELLNELNNVLEC